MSKRVANKRGKGAGARSGRIKIGWRKQRFINMLGEQQEQLSLQSVTDEVKETLRSIKKTLKKLVPKRNEMRRHQGR